MLGVAVNQIIGPIEGHIRPNSLSLQVARSQRQPGSIAALSTGAKPVGSPCCSSRIAERSGLVSGDADLLGLSDQIPVYSATEFLAMSENGNSNRT